MIPAKISAGILRSAADCIEEQGGYKGQFDILGARALAGIPAELEKVAASVHAHYEQLCRRTPAEQEAAAKKSARSRKVIDPEVAKKAAVDAAIKKAKAGLRPLTTLRMGDLLRRSTAKSGATSFAELERKLKPLKAQHEAAQSEWLASLVPGDIVRVEGWVVPAEIITIDRKSTLLDMIVMDLADGQIRETYKYSITPYDNVELVNCDNAHLVKRISARLKEAASSGDTNTIKALEAALK